MEEITTIGLDIAKSVFQVHAISATGTVVFRRQLKRRYVVQFFTGLKPENQKPKTSVRSDQGTARRIFQGD